MSPHLIVFLSAFLLGMAGKALFPHSSIRVTVGAAVAVIVVLSLYVGDWPSPLGLALVTAGSLVGAGSGVAAAKLFDWLLRRTGLDRAGR